MGLGVLKEFLNPIEYTNMKKTVWMLFTFLLCIICGKVRSQIGVDTNFNNLIETEKNAHKVLFGKQDGNRLTNSQASANFDVNYYRCEWNIDPAIRFISGNVSSHFTISQSTNSITFDLSDTLQVDSIQYHNQLVSFQRKPGDALEIQFPLTLNTGIKDSLTIFYQGVPRQNIGFGAFTQTMHSGVPVIWTLSEPYGAKEWWPCKNGLTDKSDSLEVIVHSPVAYRSSSNGVLIQEDTVAGSLVLHFKHRHPIASYLVAVAVTNYMVAKDSVLISNRQMPLMLTTYPEWFGNAARINDNARKSFALLNNAFGNYPFADEQYGHTAWSWGGGMEHQTNSFIATTAEDLIVHELAHQWFGDMITCGSWQHIWLNEGFATYAWWMYLEKYYPESLAGYLGYYAGGITSLPDGSVFVDDTSSTSRIFSGRLTYNKGAYVLHMLRWVLGDSTFFAGLRQYLSDPRIKNKFAVTDDLKRNLEAASGRDLTSFFQKWFYQQGYPVYSVNWTQDSSNFILLKINQATSHPSVLFFDMPVPVQFKNNNRDTIIVFNHTKNGQTFLVNPGFKADTAIFDPKLWILSRANTSSRTGCGAISDDDAIFPHYNIQWRQNSNNWSYVTINQANVQASRVAEDIPLYLHFSGNGRDTSFLIKNIRYQYTNWLNIGFTATNVFVSTSCFLNPRYSIANQTVSTGADEIKIFPVPAVNNTLNISLQNPSDKHLSVKLFTASGQLVYQTKFDTPGKDELFNIPLTHMARGVYFIKLESESKIRMSRKIIH